MMKYIFPILVALTFLLQACSSTPPLTPQQQLKENFQVFRDAAIKNVTEKDRLLLVLKVSQTLEKTLSDYNKAYALFAKTLGELNRNYDTPRAEQEALLSNFRNTRESIMKKVIKIHFEIVALTTQAEWKKMVKYETQAFETMRDLPPGQLGVGS